MVKQSTQCMQGKMTSSLYDCNHWVQKQKYMNIINNVTYDEIMTNIKQYLRKSFLFIWILSICCFTIYAMLKLKRKNEKLVEGIEILKQWFVFYYVLLLGRFWVFADSHVDILYRSDGDPTTHCHNVSLNNRTKVTRKFGNFNCDSPSELLISALSAAKKIDSNIDFIIWLG